MVAEKYMGKIFRVSNCCVGHVYKIENVINKQRFSLLPFIKQKWPKDITNTGLQKHFKKTQIEALLCCQEPNKNSQVAVLVQGKPESFLIFLFISQSKKSTICSDFGLRSQACSTLLVILFPSDVTAQI